MSNTSLPPAFDPATTTAVTAPEVESTPVVVPVTPAETPKIATDVAAAVATPEVQTIEQEVLAGLPVKVRGAIYWIAGLGAAVGTAVTGYSATAASLGLTDLIPGQAVAIIGGVSTILAALTAATAGSNLGKK